jgi:hypothetical protein
MPRKALKSTQLRDTSASAQTPTPASKKIVAKPKMADMTAEKVGEKARRRKGKGKGKALAPIESTDGSDESASESGMRFVWSEPILILTHKIDIDSLNIPVKKSEFNSFYSLSFYSPRKIRAGF